MIVFFLLITIVDIAYLTPVDNSTISDEKGTTTVSIAEQKCQEYIKNSVASTLLQTPADNKSISLTGVTIKKELPHMARIGYVKNSKKLWKTGGTLISEYFVLTGAISTLEIAEYVMLGSWNQDPALDDSSQEYLIQETFVHPDFNSWPAENDIALFKLNRKVEFNQHIKPICLNTKESDFKQATASGWGTVKFLGEKSKYLKIVDLQVHPDKTCADIFIPASLKYNSSTMICAGPIVKDKDTCKGDSGGPLQVLLGETNNYLQIGILSFGIGCGRVDSPSIYTQISSFIPWIEDIVWS